MHCKETVFILYLEIDSDMFCVLEGILGWK